MTGADAAAKPANGNRTRSIWWYQLVLLASVVVIAVVVLAVVPERFGSPPFAAGVSIVLGATAATLAVPWDRVPRGAVFVVPFVDIGAIGLLATSYDLRLGLLWAFPVIWIGTFAALPVLVAAIVVIAGVYVVVLPTAEDPAALVPVTIVVVTIGFMGLTAFGVARRNRAFRRLLRRQAVHHRGVAERLLTEERRLLAFAEALPDGAARLGADGRPDAVNAAWTRLWGVDPADLTQPPRAVEYSGPRGTPIAPEATAVARAARGEVFTDLRTWVFDADARWRELAVTAVRLGDEAPETWLLARDLGGEGSDGAGAMAFDLRAVVAASAVWFGQAATVADVAIEQRLDEPLPVEGDPFRLRQALDAVVGNAVKYTGAGGRVFVAARVDGDRVVVTVTDTGLGMAPDDAARAFEPMFRAAAVEATTAGAGLGLGLARDRLAEARGSISIDSRLRAGTTVTLELPSPQAGAEAPTTDAEAPAGAVPTLP